MSVSLFAVRCALVFVGWCSLAAELRAEGTYYEADYAAGAKADELQTPVTYTLWIPEGVERLRGVIVHQHGAGTTASIEGSTASHDLHWQALAKKWDCALFCSSYHVENEAIDLTPGGSEWWFDPRRGSEQRFLQALGDFATQSGHPELESVPWVLWGHSGGGIWSDVMACLHPERVVAMWLRSGSAAMFRTHPEFPGTDVPAAAFGIPTMCNPGVKEQGRGPWIGTVATFQEYRLHGAPIGFTPDPRTDHECGDSRYLAIPFLDACLAMRLPDVDSPDQSLKPIDMTSAWLAPLMGTAAIRAKDYQGDPRAAVWLPNEAIAHAWEEYVRTGAVSDPTPPPAPRNVQVAPQQNGGAVITWDAAADFESGIRCFQVLRNGTPIAQVPEHPVGQFGRPLFQSMTYHDTPGQPTPEMRYVDASAKAGAGDKYTIVTVNSVGLESPPSPPADSQSDARDTRQNMVWWSRQPAQEWLDASPLGNGLMGAMVFGRVEQERIALNNSDFWSGRPHDYNDPAAIKYFPRIKELVFARKFQEAEKMVDDHFYGIPKAQQAYQPLGDLLLSFAGADSADDYRRELDMETGISRVSFRVGDTRFTRETFLSYPDRVLVVRISADKPGKVSFTAKLDSPFQARVAAATGKLDMDGVWKRPAEENWLIAPVDGPGAKFRAALRARAEGGKSTAGDDALQFDGADSVTLLLTSATSVVDYQDISGDPVPECERRLDDCKEKDFATLRRRHVADFGGLMGRVQLSVGDESQNGKPIEERLEAVRQGMPDPNLEALIFQFGRYILAASSRAGGQPANLQGIWNQDVLPPWGSKYTININTEMNYWPAEVTNLSECHQPLFDMLKDISVTGARTAKQYYGCGGWVTHHNIDRWRGTAPVDAARFGMWPVGGAWLCQDLWEHYAFTGDKDFLREYYPVMRGAAQFLLEVMVEDPEHGWLVTPFSMSPEHGYHDQDGELAFLSPAPTMDVAIIRELFPHCIAASEILGVDEPFREKLQAALAKLPPYQIGRAGFVQEWIEDWRPGEQGHNMSPNFAFYPGSSLKLREHPKFAAAYERWLETRSARGGFPLAWNTAMWARLERGDKVDEYLRAYAQRVPALNLHNRGSNQSDASFGYTAAVAESLLQSHDGELSLLPALPTSWRDGSVSGLKGRGGYVVDINWHDGELESATINSPNGGSVRVRSGPKTAEVTVVPGRSLALGADLEPSNLRINTTRANSGRK